MTEPGRKTRDKRQERAFRGAGGGSVGETSRLGLRSGARAAAGMRREVGATRTTFSPACTAIRWLDHSTRTTRHVMPPTGLEVVYLDNREKLVRFLRARGAGEAAEDFVHDLWINVAARAEGPVANPLAYLYRAADRLMIDRYRSRRQAVLREQAWEGERQDIAAVAPSPEREVAARQEAVHVARTLEALGPRKEAIFRRVRVDGMSQRTVAEEFGVSLSTVESDLREAARALVKLKDEIR